jgi:ATP-binding cassette, subfamily F, member 3
MIEFQSVSKRFGAQDVLVAASFQVTPGDRVGIVGPNGAGKTTLFELIMREISPDSGTVTVPRDARFGYLHQQLDASTNDTPLLAYTENAVPAIRAIETELHAIEARLEQGDGETRQLLARHGALQTNYEHMGGYTLRHTAAATLGGLGFGEADFERPLAAFSGGWQMRAELARCLVSDPDILLLDEPSNYLDIPAVEWLQRYLREFKGTLLLISHDRYLLNSLATVTLELAGGRIERYTGNYDSYVKQREKRNEERLGNIENVSRKREKAERFIERFRAKATKASQVRSRVKMLERMDDGPAPVQVRSAGRMRLPEPKRSGQEVIRLEGAGASYDGRNWILRGVDLRLERGAKVALVGLNGMGKTTLMRLLTGQLPLAEGKRAVGHNVVIGYQSQEFADTIDPRQTVYEALKSKAGLASSEQQVRALLGGFGFSGATVEKPVSVLSGGEKVRLAFARLLIDPPNFLLLDEPTTHLDIAAREALETALVAYQGTLCVVSHDVQFVRRVATSIIAMAPPGIRAFVGGYDYYREKLAAEPHGRVADAREGNGAGGSDAVRTSSKTLRRERARRREEIAAESRHLRQAIQKAEKQLAVFESEQAKLLEQLRDNAASTNFADLNRRLSVIQNEIARYTKLWEESSEALEALAAEG